MDSPERPEDRRGSASSTYARSSTGGKRSQRPYDLANGGKPSLRKSRVSAANPHLAGLWINSEDPKYVRSGAGMEEPITALLDTDAALPTCWKALIGSVKPRIMESDAGGALPHTATAYVSPPLCLMLTCSLLCSLRLDNR